MARVGIHTSFNKGKRVYVRLRDGTEFVDKFVERESRYVRLETRGRIRTNEIAVMGVAKGSEIGVSKEGTGVIVEKSTRPGPE